MVFVDEEEEGVHVGCEVGYGLGVGIGRGEVGGLDVDCVEGTDDLVKGMLGK